MLNEVILACKTYDIMRYYHVKEMSLSYDCVLVVSLNRVSSVSRTEYFVYTTHKTHMKKFCAPKDLKLSLNIHCTTPKKSELIKYKCECGISNFATMCLMQIQCQGRTDIFTSHFQE